VSEQPQTQPKPVYQVTNFTNMEREVIQFDEVGANPPKRIFRGRAQVQLDPNPRAPLTGIVFEFEEKTIEECFKAWELQLGKVITQIKMQMAVEGKGAGPIIPARTMPPLPKGK